MRKGDSMKEKNPIKYIKKTLQDMDAPLSHHFMTEYFVSLLVLIFGVIFGVIMKKPQVIFLVGSLVSIMVFYVTYQIVIVGKGRVIIIEGICTDINEPLKSRKWIEIVTDQDYLVSFAMSNKISAKLGNRIRFYVPEDSVYERTEDSFSCNNIYYAYVVQTNEAQKIKNSEKESPD